MNYPEEVVLTSEDYRKLYLEDNGNYYRQKLKTIFDMNSIFIIGHSLYDPDINDILLHVKKYADPKKPIYMIGTDYTEADEKEFFEKYNISLMRYDNFDRNHTGLMKILKTMDRFIVPRDQYKDRNYFSNIELNEDEEIATSLYIFRCLRNFDLSDYYSLIVLYTIFSKESTHIAREELLADSTLNAILRRNAQSDEDIIITAVNQLIDQGFVEEQSANVFTITDKGHNLLTNNKSIRETEKAQAFGQLRVNISENYKQLTEDEFKICRRMAEESISIVFSKRGNLITNEIFCEGTELGPSSLTDIFGYISNKAIEIKDSTLRLSFIDAMHQFLIEPNPPQRKYLESVSQGFFLYHMLGLDPKCSRVRKDIFSEIMWIIDSSIILPFIAKGCTNHEYAMKLFTMLNNANAQLFTTEKIFKEVKEHYYWAVNFVKQNGVDSPEFLRAALVKGSYKQNLFLDGFIRLCAEGEVTSFEQYIEIITPGSYLNNTPVFRDNSIQFLKMININDFKEFKQDDWGDIEEAKEEIRNERERRGIYRSHLQIEAEAELWIIINNLKSGKYSFENIDNFHRVYFVSQSRIFNQVFSPNYCMMWTPESLYRYLSIFPDSNTNSDLLQQCMLHEYLYSGLSFIDKERYLRFFGPRISDAKLSFKKERKRYIEESESDTKDEEIAHLQKSFDNTPDLEKPFFVQHLAFKMAESSKRREELLRKRANNAEKKVKKLEDEKESRWKIEKQVLNKQEKARLRNLKDPKYLRKKKRQAKKQRRKKGK